MTTLVTDTKRRRPERATPSAAQGGWRGPDAIPAEARRSIGNQAAIWDAFQRVARQRAGAIAPEASRVLPHLTQIEGSFGPDHDLTSVRAQVGGSASVWNRRLGASAST